MRLSDAEVDLIKSTATKWFGADCAVRLFGSRVNDAAKGGDIDLHVITSKPEMATLDAELGFVVDLKGKIGDQRIDLVLRTAHSPEHSIDKIAKTRGVLL